MSKSNRATASATADEIVDEPYLYISPLEETGDDYPDLRCLVSNIQGKNEDQPRRSLPVFGDFGSCDEREEFTLTPKVLTNHLLNPSIKVKISPMLLITGGLPNSSKTTALRCLVRNVDVPVTGLKEGDAIGFCEIFAARNLISNSILLAPPDRNKGYPSVLYAGVESMIRSSGKKLRDLNIHIFPAKEFSLFQDPGLNRHLEEVMTDLSNHDQQKKIRLSKWDQTLTCGLALINVWDLGLNKIPTYLLSHLAGHLYNSHVWLFLDLLRDAEHLYEVPEIPPNHPDVLRNDKDLIMKWRSRIRYFLSFARLASKKNDTRYKKFCSIIATLRRPTETENKKSRLTEVVHAVSKQLKINELIDIENIYEFQTFDEMRGLESLKTLLNSWITDELKQAQDVPLSYIFLRGMLLGNKKLYIKRSVLQKISEELSMCPDMFQEFCRLFTSFGSIIDVSLIDSKSEWIISQPIQFLNMLDKLFYYNGDDELVTKYGLVTAVTSEQIFGTYSPVFMSFLESFNMAIKLSNKEVDLTLEGSSPIYYIPNVCTNLPDLQCTPVSLHLVQEMNTSLPHFRILFILKFLEYQPHIQIHHAAMESTHINVTTFTSHSNLLFELVYLGDITEFRFPSIHHSHEDMTKICGCVIQACHDVMSKQSSIKYNFAIMCSGDEGSNPCKVQTYRHSLPFISSCKKCSSGLSDKDNAKIAMFNAEIKKNRVPDEQMLNGESFTLEDAANIAERLSHLSPEVAKVVYKEFKSTDDDFEEETGWKLFMRMILDWEKNNKDSKREFVLKLSSIAENLKSDADSLIDLSSNHLRGSYLSRK
ncbi:PREDICTED: uncharacterized protein LOC109585105 [Amphimedon queenslandica]|uniref:Death domain-containing protein n=1 Tax=Amphimedon queenslandica TaxID=400682 RepID=A0AAN0JII3_AMPQE|nr:PREDICTED: uncharacterized protein LOC109585105 [Amphimedon queenslandica]|eukprot:XP_019856611.1 PREDICTED: uncharacterized protein LOC109585105 [Amphimedon queenslandica]